MLGYDEIIKVELVFIDEDDEKLLREKIVIDVFIIDGNVVEFVFGRFVLDIIEFLFLEGKEESLVIELVLGI